MRGPRVPRKKLATALGGKDSNLKLAGIAGEEGGVKKDR